MGITSTIPGVSFGAVALLLNIYEKILNSLNLGNIKKNSHFLILLCAGCLCGIFLFSKLFTFLIVEYEMFTYYCFTGMIVGCTPMIYKRAKFDKVRFLNVAIFVMAFAFMIFLAFIGDGSHVNKTLAQLGGMSIPLLIWIFFAGFISAVAMIIPGISGSIVLLMLGAYTVAIEALSTFNIIIIAVIGSGTVMGILTGAKLIKALLGYHPQAVYSAVIGLILGSTFIVFPGYSWDIYGIIAILLAIISGVFIYFFSRRN